MSGPRLFSIKNPWLIVSASLTFGFAMLATASGLIVLPYAQHGLNPRSLWDAICSAAGVPHAATPAEPIPATFKTSAVVVTSRMLDDPSAIAIGRGATLALQCAICHGSDGANKVDVPALAGQYAGVIYKELEDFKSGARRSAVMGPFAVVLRERDMLDLAAYYSYLPRVPASKPEVAASPPRIVVNGAPMRNIAPCASCHGGFDPKAGSPWLDGQPVAYLRTQMQAFATATRRNDISEQMRNIARHMTSEEMDAASRHYANAP